MRQRLVQVQGLFQCLQHLAGVLVAVLRVFLQRLHQHRVERFVDLLIETRRSFDWTMGDRIEQLVDVITFDRQLAGDHLVEHQAQ